MCVGTLYGHERTQQLWTLHLLVDLDQALSSVTGLHHCAHLQLAPPAVHLHTLGLTPVSGPHCQVPMVKPSNHDSAH